MRDVPQYRRLPQKPRRLYCAQLPFKVPEASRVEIHSQHVLYGRVVFHYTHAPITQFEEHGIWENTWVASRHMFDAKSAQYRFGLKQLPDKVIAIRSIGNSFSLYGEYIWISNKKLPPNAVLAFHMLEDEPE